METASARIDELDGAGAAAGEPRHDGGNDEVIRLARQGFTPAEIAGTLGLAEGEIRLILDLARRRSDSR